MKNEREKPKSYIKDTFEFITNIIARNTCKNDIMVSFDIESLFTNISVEESIQITIDTIYRRKEKISGCPFNREQFEKLLELCIINTPFRFMEENYIQVDGVAMGSPLAPIIADVFISKLGKKARKIQHKQTNSMAQICR